VKPDDLMGRPIALVVALALVSLLPFVFMALTAFVKISTVLQIAKSAIGAQNIPSNTVIMVLSGALTLLAMAPVGERVAAGLAPVFKEGGETTVIIGRSLKALQDPMHDFLKANASATERNRFLGVAQAARPEAQRAAVLEDDFTVLVPAFVVTELTEAFAIGFFIFLPFLVIDLVIANVLMALGLQQLNPTQVSLPFKLLLFVAIQGWGLLAQALVAGYRS
jgi:type III secretion protein R